MTTMNLNTYSQNPALKPTVLLRDLMKNVYRPSGSIERPPARPDAIEKIARDTVRAA
jgi:hypothetical protein